MCVKSFVRAGGAAPEVAERIADEGVRGGDGRSDHIRRARCHPELGDRGGARAKQRDAALKAVGDVLGVTQATDVGEVLGRR